MMKLLGSLSSKAIANGNADGYPEVLDINNGSMSLACLLVEVERRTEDDNIDNDLNMDDDIENDHEISEED